MHAVDIPSINEMAVWLLRRNELWT